ncbi:MAG: hypothetical protein ACTSU5_02015 [Promethearchaeota archaeon]
MADTTGTEVETWVVHGSRAWRFLLKVLVSRDNVSIGLDAIRFVAREVWHVEEFVARHHHGPDGSDYTSPGSDPTSRLEFKFLLHLLSNRNKVVDAKVSEYRGRGGGEGGIVFVTVVCRRAGGQARAPRIPKEINILPEIYLLVVKMTHEVGEKAQVKARDIIAAAQEALAGEFPDGDYEELERDEFIALLQIRGMQTIDKRIDVHMEEIDALRSDVDGIRSDVDGIRSDMDGIRSDVKGMKDELEEIKRLLLEVLKPEPEG